MVLEAFNNMINFLVHEEKLFSPGRDSMTVERQKVLSFSQILVYYQCFSDSVSQDNTACH